MKNAFPSVSQSFTNELVADINQINTPRQVLGAHFSLVTPTPPISPKLIHFSKEVAKLLELDLNQIEETNFISVLSGEEVLTNTLPYAMCYGGHQFGHWAGQLGDGRAINLFEVTTQRSSFALQLKGAGPTPYSRTADGYAVLRSSVREYLCSEAMFHLGIPTTRALSLIISGKQVLRDVLYNGNAAYEQGAVVCRVAPSFIRFGNFEMFSARNDINNLQLLADYTIAHFYPTAKNESNPYLSFYNQVAINSLEMVMHWKRVGFVHGVMNTDNMSILGLTIDYGPFGFLDDYNPEWTPNTTDASHRRYRFGNQADMVFWNLIQLANALYPLIKDKDGLNQCLENWKKEYYLQNTTLSLKKIGLNSIEPEDTWLLTELENNLQICPIDLTIFYRELSKLNLNNPQLKTIKKAFYPNQKRTPITNDQWQNWLTKYASITLKSNINLLERIKNMNQTNPKYILRNYMLQLAIEAAEKEDYSIINELAELIKSPYEEQENLEKWYQLRPDWALNKVGCSALSCSS
jgi:serine/tyrosine/threonine adenylyltransferase